MTAIVVADAPGPGCLPGLASRLRPAARMALQRELIARAAAWAVAAARGWAVVAVAGAVPDDLAAALPAGVALVAAAAPGSIPADAALAAAEHGPLLLAGAGWPRLSPEHAAGAWADLDAGTGAVFGPALDGGAYLVGLAEPVSALLALPPGPAGLPRAIEAARVRGHEIGLLRHERALAGPDDAAAFLADPLLAPELRAALER